MHELHNLECHNYDYDLKAQFSSTTGTEYF